MPIRKPVCTSRRLVGLLALAILCACPSGCVQRRMTIRSNPPGALVYVDDYEIGTTPISTNFTYYGTRRIRLVKDGYETLTVLQPIPAPWYQIPPIDFVAENFVPGDIRDNRTLEYTLTPQVVVPTEQILENAESLRRQTRPAPGSPYLPVTPTENLPGGSAPLPSPAPSYSPAPQPPLGGQPTYPIEPPGGWQSRPSTEGAPPMNYGGLGR